LTDSPQDNDLTKFLSTQNIDLTKHVIQSSKSFARTEGEELIF